MTYSRMHTFARAKHMRMRFMQWLPELLLRSRCCAPPAHILIDAALPEWP